MAKKRKTPPPIAAEQSVSEAFAAILVHNLDYLIEWEDAARSWDDIEGVHQTRIAFRRMRSAISAFQQAVPKAASAAWSEELRWLGNQLGMARDLDVFIDEGLGPLKGVLPLPGEAKLLRLAEDHRARAYETVRAMLTGERYGRFKQDFPTWIRRREWEQGALKQKQRKRLNAPLVPFARKLLDRLERRVLQAGTHVDRDKAEEMHQLRIECKKLRYAAEFFIPLFKGMEDFIGHMKGLQDLLGVMNDVAVMKHLLEELLGGQECDPEVLPYAGGLVGWRTRQFHDLMGSFDDRWEELTNAKHPWWRKDA